MIVYWFMFPVCVAVASVAMFSGISGAALLMPVFLVGFPLLGVPTLSVVGAIGISLLLETSGFGTGVASYIRRGLVDTGMAGRLAAVTVPLGALGAVVSGAVPGQALRIGYGVLMVVLAWVLLGEARSTPAEHEPSPAADDVSGGGAHRREVVARDGTTYRFAARGVRGQMALSGAGALLAGMISTGVGEATLPGLVRRSGYPVAVAAATSTVVVAATVVGAAGMHLVTLFQEGGLAAIPWNLLVWAIPGSILGALLGSRLQGRIDERVANRFFAALFLAIGLTILAIFTVGSDLLAT